MTNERSQVDVLLKRGACPYCKAAVQPAEHKVACDGCMTWHHAECWTSHGACSACGGDRLAGLERTAATAPVSRPVCAHEGCELPALTSADYQQAMRYRSGARCKEHSLTFMNPRAGVYTALSVLGLSVACELGFLTFVEGTTELLPFALFSLVFAAFWLPGALCGVLELRRLRALPDPKSDVKGA